MRRLAFLAILAAALATAQPGAQQPPAPGAPPQRAQGTIRSEATAILVDVVVRDRRGNPILDLEPKDFEIEEDGVLQEIGSVTLFSEGAVASRGAEPKAAPAAADAEPRTSTAAPPSPVIALVFDSLTPEARALAHKAAMRYIASGEKSEAMMGVFGIDLSLQTYQPYTYDAAQLRRAVDAFANRSTSQFGGGGDAARNASDRAAGASAAASTFEQATAAGGPAAGQAAQGGAAAALPEAQMAEMQRRMLETFDMLERDQQGLATSNSLLALVNSMRTLPGRKSLIFFSEGLAIPANVASQFRSVIDTANRANVTIYTMDAAGLRTESTSTETRDNIMEAASRNLRRNPTADVVGQAMTQGLERNEDLLRRDPHSGLGQLAGETGGLLIRDSNDLTNGFRRVDDDMRNYYMLSYVPTNDKYDGRFRTISVNVKRSGSQVAARKGYYAVRTPGGVPLLTFEAPAVAMLETTPVPNAFPVRASALRFPDSERPGLAPVFVTLPASAIGFQTDEKTYRAEFTVLVRFRDQASEIVRKMSQHYELNGPIDRLGDVKQGNVLFYREAEVPAGVYTVETVVYDNLAGKGSVRFGTFEQPRSAADASATRVSSLVLIGRGERLPEAERPKGNPFLVGDLLLYPNLGEPLKKGRDRELAFYFTVHPAPGAKLTAVLELMQNGKLMARSPLELGAPDDRGRVQHVSRLPLESIPAGSYDLRVLVGDGKATQLRAVKLTVSG